MPLLPKAMWASEQPGHGMDKEKGGLSRIPNKPLCNEVIMYVSVTQHVCDGDVREREATAAGIRAGGWKHPAKFVSFVPKSFNFSRDDDDNEREGCGLIMKLLRLALGRMHSESM